MVLYKCRHWADLHHIRVIGRVLKQAVVRVKHLLRQQEEELPGWAAVVQTMENTSAILDQLRVLRLMNVDSV